MDMREERCSENGP